MNVVDGDSPKQLKPQQIQYYTQERIKNFQENTFDENDITDKYFSTALKEAEKIGIDIHSQVLMVLQSMQFDANRRVTFLKTGELQVQSRSDLNKHYSSLDTFGVIGSMLPILDEENSYYNQSKLALLGNAMRMCYDVKDLKKEVRQGCLNISQEDLDTFNIDLNDLQSWAKGETEMPSSISHWIKHNVSLIQELYKEYQNWIKESNLKPFTKAFLHKYYEEELQEFLEKN